MRRITSSVAISLLAMASVAQAATPEDTIKYRKAVMETMAGHIAGISMIFGGKIEAQEYLLSHAEALAAAGDEVGKLFPAGSGTGKTEALPLIWQEGDGFRKAAETAKTSTAALRDAIKGGDKAAIGKALKSVGDSCKGCHDRYRHKD
ncbi:MAG: cytochrome c [Gammaproteobacteria bacterium]|nr:cytochrome c [Gammaproteobacteria bacterium]